MADKEVFIMCVRSCPILKHTTKQHCLLCEGASTHWVWKRAVVLLNK